MIPDPFSFIQSEISILDPAQPFYTQAELDLLFKTPKTNNTNLFLDSPAQSPLSTSESDKEINNVDIKQYNQKLYDQMICLTYELIEDASYKAEYDKRMGTIDQIDRQVNKPYSCRRHHFVTMTDAQQFKINNLNNVQKESLLCQHSNEKAKVLKSLQNPIFSKKHLIENSAKISVSIIQSSVHKSKVVTQHQDIIVTSLVDDFYIDTGYNRMQHLNEQITQQIKRNDLILNKSQKK
ncbi:hypothetical protein SS50377_20892 [Spironucleus salmonicida]|uniref:Uncharacterized protein n=1 Tax=Spironucleus salmonicida TaxID=348837 RepID=V6LGB4_9EUKA|nr:hypothetical protein SS50377_20892 [Spironucleus salmonicida]|eukprot:EST43567.1 Hypothetical protein SS50377_16607 [Spironucleus salmonicida]